MKTRKSKPIQPRRRGAPRTAIVDLPIYDSISSCSASTGIPVAVLKQAKRSGCKAFKSTRVYLGELLPWIFSRETDDAVNWGERHKKFQALRGELAYGREKSELADRGDIREAARAIRLVLSRELEQTFCAELPADAKGSSEVEIRDKSKAAIGRLNATLDREFAVMEGTKQNER